MLMNNDALINHLAKITGSSRKQVLDVLKQMSTIPEVRNELDRIQHVKKGRKDSI